MASTILVKRSTGTTVPSSLEFGELAITVGAGTQVNRGDRIFVGDNNTTVQVIGGKYFTDMLDHVHGTLTSDSAVITDNNSKVDRFRVDDVNIDANVIETDTTDTDLIFRANGTGKLVVEDSQELEFGTTGDIEFRFDEVSNVLRLDRVGANIPELRLQDDLKIQFGSGGEGSIRYDETTTNKVRVEGADWQYDNGVQIYIADTTVSNSVSTGAVVIDGGLGVGGVAWLDELRVDDNAIIGTANTDTLTVNSETTFQANVTFNGTQTVSGTINQTGQFNLDNIRLDGNTISTNAGNQLILDPDPRNGDAAGDLVVRGNLQVAGTTTTVNSTQMTVNDPVFNLGDDVSEKVIKSSAVTGSTSLSIDNPSGIIVGSAISGTSIGTGRTISGISVTFSTSSGFSSSPSVGAAIYTKDGSVYEQIGTFISQTGSTVAVQLSSKSLRESSFYENLQLADGNTGTPQTVDIDPSVAAAQVFVTTLISIAGGGTIGALAEGDAVTITQGSDDGMDRGIAYTYLDGATTKIGFFGYDRTGSSNGTGAFTFIEDATNTNNIFTHVVGAVGTIAIEKNDLDEDSGTVIGGQANQTYTAQSATGGSGSGATLTVVRDGTGAISSVTVADGGTYYQDGDLLTVSGANIGGNSPADDLEVRILSVSSSRGTVVMGTLELDEDLATPYGGTGRSEFNSKGILYGNGTGNLLETAAANMANPGVGPDVATSFQILTVTAGGVPVWTDTIDGGTFT